MEFLTRVLSGNSRLKERAREAEPVNQAFKENLDNLKRLLESEESDDISALLDMVYESSFPEEQVFMKTPSRARLKSKKELVVRLLIGLDSLGVPAMAEMLVFVRKHGPEGVADSLMTLLEFMSPLLAGKEAPVFSTDDVVDAMDFEWHSTSRTGSPLLNVIASVTSSPRASTASVGDSPLHPSISASPYRRPFSERLMLVSQANELGAKSVLDKTSTALTPPQKMMSANQGFRPSELTILETPASLDITQVSAVEKPSSYSLDTLPESGSQRRISSLQQLFVEDGIEELSREGSMGASSKRHSSSSSWQREAGHGYPHAEEGTVHTHEKDARHTCSSDICEENVGYTHMSDNDDQCEKLLSELDAIEEDILCEGGELPLTNDIEGGQMGMYDGKMEGKNQEEDSAIGYKEKMQLLDEKVGIIDESVLLMKENSEKEFLDDEAHFIMGAAGDYIQRPPAQFTEPYASESQPLHEDYYIQRPPAQFTEPYAAAVHDHEHQNADHLSHVFPASNKTDPPYAPLPHGHPTFSSISGDGESSNQQPASDPATMDRWDSDTKVPRYKRKGNFMGKMKCGYLSCCTRPPTNS